MIWENFCYRFAGKTYRQSSGGPIGARVTMCVARLIMQDWGERYRELLVNASLRIALLNNYVDDVRQGCTLLKMGMRFNEDQMEFTWTLEAEIEDKEKREIENESDNRRMARVCLPAMNSINEDLEFTAEVPEDFKDEKLPTLDFKTWPELDKTLNFVYFEKEMRTQFVIMKRSAISDHQSYQILSNELIRRLSNIDREKNSIEEQKTVIEHLTKQLK